MIQIPFGAFANVSVPADVDVTVAVPQADPLNFLTAQKPFQIVVFTAPAAEGGGGVTSWNDLEDRPTISPFGLSLIDDADAATARDTLGLGDAATRSVGTSAGQVRDAADAAYTNARTPTAHTHPLTDLTQTGAVTRQVAEWSGSAWGPATPPLYIVNTSARSAQIPDSTAAGGGNRGPNSVDLQSWRTLATQIASGTGAAIGGGRNNTASGGESAVAGGSSNTASGERATVGGGEVNSATSTRATVSGGAFNLASGPNSGIPWGFAASTFGIYGAYAWQAQNRGNFGDNQQFGGLLGATTTNATPVVLTADRSAPRTTANNINVHVMPNNSVWSGFVYVTARNVSTNDVASWLFWVTARRGASASATSVIGSIPVATQPDGLSAASVLVDENTSIGSIEVTATGIDGELDWTCGFFGIMNYR